MTTTSSRELPATEALIVSLDEYIRARYGLLAVQTFEEERFIRFMRGVADHERHRAKGLYLWSRTRGLRLVAGPGVGAEPRAIPNREDPLSLIEYIEEAEQGLYVLRISPRIYWSTVRQSRSWFVVCGSSRGRSVAGR